MAEFFAGLRSTTMDRVGPYKIVEEISRGGMGVVHRAVDEHIRRSVAVEIIRFDEPTDPTHRAVEPEARSEDLNLVT